VVCGEAGALEALGAGLRRNQRGEIDELPCLQGDQLVAGLAWRIPTADWLDETSPLVSARDVSSACTTPAWTRRASW